MGWLRLVGSLKLQVYFADYSLFIGLFLAKEISNFKGRTNRSHLTSLHSNAIGCT